MKRVLGAAGITAAVLLGSMGCGWDDDQERVVRYGVAEPVRELVIDGHTGGIDVRAGDAVRVVERQNFGGEPPQTTHEVKDGTLRLTYDCDDCGVGYEVTVPAGTVVRVSSETGGVKLAGLAGEVRATVGTGGVTASGLTSPTVRVSTGTGGIEVGFAASPTTVEARANTGGVRVTVPQGEEYAVDARADAGGVDVGVPRHDGGARRITAHTDTGGVTVRHG
ncbi:DUF4097 family beta strand repeat-containing protein [Kitasatospora sp. NPDC004240]